MRVFSSIVTFIVISLTFSGCSDKEAEQAAAKTSAKSNVQIVANYLANEPQGGADDATKKAIDAVRKMEEKDVTEALAELLKDVNFFKAQVTDPSVKHDQFMKDDKIKSRTLKQVYDNIKAKLDKLAPEGEQNAAAEEGSAE